MVIDLRRGKVIYLHTLFAAWLSCSHLVSFCTPRFSEAFVSPGGSGRGWDLGGLECERGEVGVVCVCEKSRSGPGGEMECEPLGCGKASTTVTGCQGSSTAFMAATAVSQQHQQSSMPVVSAPVACPAGQHVSLMSAPVQCVCPDVSMCVIQTPRDDPLLPQPKIASDCLPNPRGEEKVTALFQW